MVDRDAFGNARYVICLDTNALWDLGGHSDAEKLDKGTRASLGAFEDFMRRFSPELENVG